MTETYKIYIDTLMESLEELSNEDFQRSIWLNQDNPNGMVASFTEAVIGLFDDAIVIDALENNQIIFDRKVTQALQELHDATDAVDEFRSTEEIIADPTMENVRQKATATIRLIEMSNGSENTVRLIKRGES